MIQRLDQLDRRRTLILLASVAVTAVLAWALVSYPYYPFPNEDRIWASDPSQWNHSPLFSGSLWMFNAIWHAISAQVYSPILIQTLFYNAISGLVLAVLVYRVSRQTVVALIFAVLYFTSPWVANYYFVPSYVSETIAFLSVNIFFLVEAALTETVEEERKYLRWSGVFAGLMLLTTPSGPTFLISELGWLALVFWPIDRRKILRIATDFGLPTLLIGGVGFLGYHEEYLRHLHANVTSEHKTEAMARFGYVPQIPAFSFLYISWAYSAILCVGSILLMIWVLAMKTRDEESALHRRIALGLAAFIIVNSLELDLLPFSKLGRAHLGSYCILLVFDAIVLALLVKKRGWRAWMAAALLAAVLFRNLMLSAEVVHHRRGALKPLIETSKTTKIFLLQNDPHAMFLAKWLPIEFGATPDARQLLASYGGPSAVLVGPHGPQSGMSILERATLPDFAFDESSIPAGAKKVVLPYYAYEMPFLMEEEVAQGLYFEGKTPDPNLERLQLTLYILK